MDHQGRGNRGRGSGGRGKQDGPGRAWRGDGGRGGGRQGDRDRHGRGAYGGAWQQAASTADSPGVLPGRRAPRGAPLAAPWMAAPGWGAAAEVGPQAAPWWAAPLRAAVSHLLWGLLLWINSYLLHFNREKTIVYHYDVDVRPEDLPGGGAAAEVPRPDLSAVKAEFFRVYAAQFPAQTVAYDGQRSLLSPALHRHGDFWVAVRGLTFHVTLKLVKVYGTFEGAAYRYVEDVMYFD